MATSPNAYCVNPECSKPENPVESLNCLTCGFPLLIRNRYRAFKKIGQGGFGSTFLVRDEDLPSKPWRVLKQLRPVDNSPQIAQLAQELFYREAQVLEKLGEHSQIPKLYAYFEENTKFYLVQEFIQGVTLSKEMQRSGSPFTEDQAKQVLQEMLLILSYVHSHNTVHRDIKPANLIRRKEDQRLVLIDFGAVKELGPSKEDSQVEVTAIRSLGFSPPEQVAGQAVSPASDLYALGATCLNLLTMESPARFYDHSQNRWDWSERVQLTPEFESILVKMLQPGISYRYGTATEVLRALQSMSDDTSPTHPIILPQSYGSQGSAGQAGVVSSHWSSRRPSSTTGFSPTPIRPSRPSPPTLPAGGGSSTTGFSGAGRSTVGFTASSSPSRSTTGFSSMGRQTTGFNRLQPTTPRIPSMSGADLRDRSLVKSNLAGRDIRNADLRGTDLSGANLQRADLRGVQFNTPQPAWLRTLNWMLGQAKTAGGIAVGILLLLGSVALVFWIMRLVFNNFWIALTGGILTAIMALSVLWPLAGRLNLKTGDESRKRSTCLRKADLRGAQMDAKLRDFARRQGATID